MNNIFNVSGLHNDEVFDVILKGKEFTIERIASPPMPDGDKKWYNQQDNELVILLQGSAAIEFDDKSLVSLKPGDYFVIKAHRKHRVAFTGEGITLWLAIHYKD